MDKPKFELDTSQKQTFRVLSDFLNKKQQVSFFSLFKNNSLKNGIYLYGPVGRGKTLIMQECFKLVKKPKKILHYQEFVEKLHKDIHRLKSSNKNKILQTIAKSYSSRYKFLFIDEFEIKDITDAMMVVPLFNELIKQKQFIFLTSNTKPSNLYKNGLQRDLFLPYIKIIEKQFEIVILDSQNDYRFSNFPQDADRILYPLTENTNSKINKVITELTNNNLHIGEVEVFGRKIIFNSTYNNILISDFEELFLRDLSYIDYINICRKFSVITITNVKTIEPNNTDVAVRFINFIDNAYFAKVIIYMTLEVNPARIYQGEHRAAEFHRALSRIYEMNSTLYTGKHI